MQLAKNASMLVAAYFTSWSVYQRAYEVTDVPVNSLSHITYAFASLESSGEIVLGDQWADVERVPPGSSSFKFPRFKGNLGSLNALKQKHRHLKVGLSVGGWAGSSNFSAVAANPASRALFATSASKLMRTYNFDYLDVDWEYPVAGGASGHAIDDSRNFLLLMQAVRMEFEAMVESEMLVSSIIEYSEHECEAGEPDDQPRNALIGSDLSELIPEDITAEVDSILGSEEESIPSILDSEEESTSSIVGPEGGSIPSILDPEEGSIPSITSSQDSPSLSSSQRKRPQLVAALPCGFYTGRYADLQLLGEILDWAGVMCYDLSGDWGQVSEHHSALYARRPEQVSADQGIRELLASGFPADKIVLGIPAYGMLFNNCAGLGKPFAHSGGKEPTIPYSQITKGIRAEQGRTAFWEPATAGTLWTPQRKPAETIVYDSVTALSAKIAYAQRLGLRGIMFWELSGDARLQDSLIRHAGTELASLMDRDENTLSYPRGSIGVCGKCADASWNRKPRPVNVKAALDAKPFGAFSHQNLE